LLCAKNPNPTKERVRQRMLSKGNYMFYPLAFDFRLEIFSFCSKASNFGLEAFSFGSKAFDFGLKSFDFGLKS